MMLKSRLAVGAFCAVIAIGGAACVPPGGGGPSYTITRVTSGTGTAEEAAISADGSTVVYSSDTLSPGKPHIYAWARASNTTTQLTTGNEGEFGPWVSGDGRYVVFTSASTDIAGLGDTTNIDAFLLDRNTSTFTRLTDDTGVAGHAKVSADGTKVAYDFSSTLYSNIYVYSIAGATTTQVTAGTGNSTGAALGSDGTWLTFVSNADDLVGGDTNGNTDAFLYNTSTLTTTRITNLPTPGASSTSVIDSVHLGVTTAGDVFYNEFTTTDFVTYTAITTKRYEQSTSTTSVVLSGSNRFLAAPPSADGRYVLYGSFTSYDASLVVNNGSLAVLDRNTSQSAQFATGNVAPYGVSDNGRYAAYVSDTTSPGPDNNGAGLDVFLYDRNS